jgi:pepF/M3 family oligoendopeptidase
MTTTAAPRWDMTNVYPALDSPEFRNDFDRYDAALTEFEGFLDAEGIRRLPDPPGAVDDALLARTERLIGLLNDLSMLGGRLNGYVNTFITTDSYNNEAAGERSKLMKLGVRLESASTRVTAWLGSLAALHDGLAARSDLLKQHHYMLGRAALKAKYQMDEPLEKLASELLVDGSSAFTKLQGDVTSQKKYPFAKREGDAIEQLPMPALVNLRADPDPEVRERAHHAEVAGWAAVRTPVAAAINSVKGTALTLAKWRGRDDVLDIALENNRIDKETLDAMLGAIRDALPMFRTYFAAKAKKLGKDRLAWWDIFAPVGDTETTYTWPQAVDFIVSKFSSFTPDLGAFAKRSFDGNWIDAEPRDGKRGGAFCMPVPAVEESRVLMNFNGAFVEIQTLAHELGHAYHNECQRGLPMLLRGAPSTLAETASIFCETLVDEAVLSESAGAERLMVLETSLCRAAQVCVDILSRFIFETNVFERRAERELSADELCELMTDAQSQTYGDAVDPETYHPYMWLWKPHYYSQGYNYYNFPYAFGHLFGLGLYAIYVKEGAAFADRYTDLLRSTNQDDAAPLAERFGIDIRSKQFWADSLAQVGKLADEFARS